VASTVSRSAPRDNRAGALQTFKPLEGTRVELLAVRDSFERFPEGRVRVLRQQHATEAAVRERAPPHRYLHLATHGFFAPPKLRSALAPAPQWTFSRLRGPLGGVWASAPLGVLPVLPSLHLLLEVAGNEATADLFGREGLSGLHPGLLSGLALAGANQPMQPERDDGILTALEVAELDLRGV
jgi:hypothetical protein